MIRFSLFSDKGSRENNEDNVGMYQDGEAFCFLLADGLGGHGTGEVASQLAVETAVGKFAERTEEDSFLRDAFEAAQESIVKRQQEDRTCRDMKTTLVILDIGKDRIRWGHIGDSRLYYFVNGRIRERTLDHSVPQMLVSAGEIKEKAIRHHPDRNRLLRVLGTDGDEEPVNYQESEVIKRTGRQAFLLCTDGFWELIEEKKMEAALKKASSPEQWITAMQEIICKNGRGTNMDNYSAVAVWAD